MFYYFKAAQDYFFLVHSSLIGYTSCCLDYLNIQFSFSHAISVPGIKLAPPVQVEWVVEVHSAVMEVRITCEALRQNWLVSEINI